MSYTKVKIGGKSRGVKYGMGAYIIYCDLMECGVEGLDNIGNPSSPQWFKSMTAIVYAGLKTHDRWKKEPSDYTFDDVANWMDDFDQGEFNKVMEAYKASKLLGKTLYEHADQVINSDGEKKS